MRIRFKPIELDGKSFDGEYMDLHADVTTRISAAETLQMIVNDEWMMPSKIFTKWPLPRGRIGDLSSKLA